MNQRLRLFLALAGIVVVCIGGNCQSPPPAAGSYYPLSATDVSSLPSYRNGDRVIGTYYFYWYRWKDACAGDVCSPSYTRSHIEFATGVHELEVPASALTNHPVNLESWDFADPGWHRAQLEQIRSASIDLILPVWWGVPGRYNQPQAHFDAAWSKVGLEALVKAMESLEKEGRAVPRIGMFYDTSTLQYESPYNYKQGEKCDLRTVLGKNHFYYTIRDFYSLVPPRYWALWEGQPLIWLYASEFSKGFDATLFPETKTRFAGEFGGLSPLFVAHTDWYGAQPDWVFRWGGATLPSFLSVTSIGPGFDNSGAFAQPKGSRVLKDRDEGAFYRNNWELALRAKTPVVILETWNELHEGTEICPTVEDGTRYLSITKEYSTRFLKGDTPSAFPGTFDTSQEIHWSGETTTGGIIPIGSADGNYREVVTAEGKVLEAVDTYLYFQIDDSYAFATKDSYLLELEFFDLPATVGSLHTEYDSWDQKANYFGIYKQTQPLEFTGTMRWKSGTLPMTDGRFANNQNEGADFRTVVPRGTRIKSVKIIRQPAVESATPDQP